LPEFTCRANFSRAQRFIAEKGSIAFTHALVERQRLHAVSQVVADSPHVPAAVIISTAMPVHRRPTRHGTTNHDILARRACVMQGGKRST
jgi:hypothetical protein